MTITRTAFCSKCAGKCKPAKGNKFILWGTDHNQYYVAECEDDVARNLRGFTPHIFSIKQRNKDKLVVSKICGMDGCGVSLEKVKKKYSITFLEESIVEMETSEWNALVKYKDAEYHI